MKDDSKDHSDVDDIDASSGFRIIDPDELASLEADALSEEAVTRLPKEKKRALGDLRSVQPTVKDVLDKPEILVETTEDGWKEVDAERPFLYNPWIWILGIVALVVVIVGVNLKSGEAGGAKAADGVSAVVEQPPQDEHFGVKEKLSSEQGYKELKTQLKGFLAASSIEEMLPYVRHSKRVRPLMEEYYSRNPIEPKSFESFQGFGGFEYKTIDLKPFWVAGVVTKEGKKHPVLIEDDDGQYLIDWETFVAYQPFQPKPWEDFIKSRPAGEHVARVRVTLAKLYIYEYHDREKWCSVLVEMDDSTEPLYAFFDRTTSRGTNLFKKLSQKGPRGRIAFKKAPIVARFKFPNDKRSKDTAEIVEIESALWVFVADPSLKEKKSENSDK